jgi:hypothetical protein
MCSEEYKNKFLLAYSELFEKSFDQEKPEEIKKFINSYGTEKESPLSALKFDYDIKFSDIEMKNYESIYRQDLDSGE